MEDSIRNEVVMRFDELGTSRAVVLEDDGRVAYAYLLEGNSLVSDVWLYNVDAAPESADWNIQSAMPFLNPAPFCKQEAIPRLSLQSIVNCDWEDIGVVITIDGIVIARLERGAKPGWSHLARKSGPLAHPLQ